MVFTKLSAQEKDAFFGLLDEYFQSRPELFERHGGGGQGVSTAISTAAAASAVQRALATNAAGASASAGFKSANPYAAAIAGATPNNNNNSADAGALARGAVSAGRVAAASLAFRPQAPGGGGHSNNDAAGGPPTLPRRAGVPTPTPPPPSGGGGGGSGGGSSTLPGAEIDKLVTRKASVFDSFKKAPTAGVSIPPAFGAPRNTYGPPPVRRTTSDTGAGAGGGAGVGVRAASVSDAPEPAEEVAEGEWAEVLYEYSSADPGDLTIEAGTRVFVTAKSSEDWWTGQVEGQGREGLFPASYVKLL